MTVAGELARYALSVTFGSLPQNVVHQAKRQLLDSLGCAIGGFDSEAGRIVQKVVRGMGGKRESTVIGSGLRTTCLNATLANGVMLRYLDYLDTYIRTMGAAITGGHPCEVIPGALAIGERQHAPGRDVLAAIVMGYELSARFADSEVNVSMEHRGWNVDTRAGIIMPLVAGKLLGLTAEQMENAVGIGASYSAVLGILDAPDETYTMTKNLRFPRVAQNGVLAALLAREGFTGPTRVIEGNAGFVRQVMQGEFDLATFSRPGDAYKIMETQIKSFCADAETQGHLSATLQLVKEHDIKPGDVAEVHVRAGTRTVEHTGDPAKRYPTNKETADHSSYYLTAIAIFDRAIGPEQFAPEKLADPRVRQLIDKVTLKVDPELDRLGGAGEVEIVTVKGERFRLRVDYPRGHPRNPMTDAEVEDKFNGTASRYFPMEQRKRIIDTVWGLDSLDDVNGLMRPLVFPRRS